MTEPTWRELAARARERLAVAGVDDAAVEARWIVEQVSGRDATELARDADESAPPRAVQVLESMLVRRIAGEPLQYVLGRWGFRTLDLMVDRRVLIPRPETEVVAGVAVDELRELGRDSIAVDLGTGSGAIALSIAAELWPHAEVWATDRSTDALDVASANLAGLGRRATTTRLVAGDWYDALPLALAGSVDVVVSNPPYVASGERLPPEVADWEPVGALYAGDDGLDAVRVIVAGAPRWLRPGGLLVVEVGETQGDAAIDLARGAGFDDVRVVPDLAGRDRVLLARRG